GDRVAPDAGRDGVRIPRPGTGRGRADRQGQRAARGHPQLADADPGQTDPPDRRLRAADVRLQLPRPDRQPAGRDHGHPRQVAGGDLLMHASGARRTRSEPIGRCMAQLGMVMNLDKCIGCHTCSVTCKQAWTNRSGVEYVWFNNVETRPGQGYPRRYQDQQRWRGGWVRTRRGRLRLRAGGRLRKLLTIFANPVLPNIRDYYEPWTYDYANLTDAPLGEDFPVARPKSLISGEPMRI